MHPVRRTGFFRQDVGGKSGRPVGMGISLMAAGVFAIIDEWITLNIIRHMLPDSG
jgi:hypothetical protein